MRPLSTTDTRIDLQCVIKACIKWLKAEYVFASKMVIHPEPGNNWHSY